MNTPDELKALLKLDDIEVSESAEGWSGSTLIDQVVESLDDLFYEIRIDRSCKRLQLYTQSGELIGTIGKGDYKKGNFYTSSHLYKKIEKKFRGKGYGVALIQEYIDAKFLLPNREYTTIFKTYKLLQKFLYVFHSIINPETGREIFLDEIPSDENIKKLISKGYVISMKRTDYDTNV